MEASAASLPEAAVSSLFASIPGCQRRSPARPFRPAAGRFRWRPTASQTAPFLYVANNAANSVSVFLIDPPIDPPSGMLLLGGDFPAGGNPLCLAVDASGNWLFLANNFSDNLTAYQIDWATEGGALVAMSGSPYPTGHLPWAVAVDPTGNFVYVTNMPENSITAYQIADQELWQVVGSLFPTASQPGAITTTRTPQN